MLQFHRSLIIRLLSSLRSREERMCPSLEWLIGKSRKLSSTWFRSVVRPAQLKTTNTQSCLTQRIHSLPSPNTDGQKRAGEAQQWGALFPRASPQLGSAFTFLLRTFPIPWILSLTKLSSNVVNNFDYNSWSPLVSGHSFFVNSPF